MTLSQTVVWTALPNGITGDPTARSLLLSVLVSPRLASDQPQAPLSGDFADWPARLADATFTVHVPGVAPVTATRVGQAPDSALWKALFGPSTTVESYAFDALGDQQVYNSYSASDLHGQIRQRYQQLGVNSMVGVDRAGLRTAFAPLLSAFTGSGSGSGPGSASPIAATDPAVTPFARLAAFHGGATFPVSTPPPAPPTLDFHQALTFLADHPELMRRLGLLIDLELPAGALPPSPQLLQVVPVFTSPLVGSSLSPSTAYLLTGDQFFEAAPTPAPVTPTPAPAPTGTAVPDRVHEPGPTRFPTVPAPNELVHGLLNLPFQNAFEIIQLDLDSSGLKVINMLCSLASTPTGPDDGSGLPALRTSGVSIARAGQAVNLLNRMSAAAATNAALTNPALPGGGSATLYAEDLVRGYRMDVQDVATGTWLSLHQRVGTYTFTEYPGGPFTVTITDEGAVQPVASRRLGPDGVLPDPASPWFIHESLLRWQGWSLAAPHPGLTITDSGPGTVTSQPPIGGLPLQAGFQVVPGTLPRLRFGRAYLFRVRAVDLAGNGPDLAGAQAVQDALTAANTTVPVLPPADGPPYVHRRFEPVLSPVLVPAERFSEGECTQRLVIRSRTGTSTAQYAGLLNSEVPTVGPPGVEGYFATCARHAAPPSCSQAMAEAHGVLDASFGTGAGFTQTYNISRKEKGSLSDNSVIDIGTGLAVPIPGITHVAPGTGIVTTRPSVEQVSGPDGGYVVHHEDQLQLPYLPDPLARGAALFGVPGVPDGQAGMLDASGALTFAPSALSAPTLAALGGPSVHLDFGANWPEQQPFRIQLAEPDPTRPPGTRLPSWDPRARVLTVYLAQAEQAQLRLSSYLSTTATQPADPALLDSLGVWRWVADYQPPGPDDVPAALLGGHRMLTPSRTVQLVHAVEAPLAAPAPSGFPKTAPRDLEATFAYVGGSLTVHGPSTAKVDLLATWTDQLDLDTETGPMSRARTAHVLTVPVTLPGEDDGTPVTPADTVSPAGYDPVAGVITFQPPSPGDESGRTYLARHEFGDTKARTVSYQGVATSRFREYFPPAVTGDPQRITVTGPAVAVQVPSTARPAGPTVVSVLPTFTWQRDTNPDGSRVSGRSSGIRVYLDRPWFSSGDGELLGVVFNDITHYPPTEQVAPYVTQWGQDLVFTSHPIISSGPQSGAFVGAAATQSGLQLSEFSVQPNGVLTSPVNIPDVFSVAGYPVQFDADRGLWYCDIQLAGPELETYTPFVRLALARYQPNSLPGLELSRVVRADAVQVPPPRTVTLTPTANPDVFQLLVQGQTYYLASWHDGDDDYWYVDWPDGPINPRPALVEVTVEERVQGASDDLGWNAYGGKDSSVLADPNVQLAGQGPPTIPKQLWTGTVTLPPGRTDGQFRIVVRECEHLGSDRMKLDEEPADSVPTSSTGPGTGPHPETPVTGVPVTKVEIRIHPGYGRLVFAETLEVGARTAP